MASHAYHFVTTWLLDAPPAEVADVLGKPEELPRWWPSVYLDVQVLERGAPGGVGKVVSLFTKGFLPYTLRWTFRVTRSDPPHGYALEATGDFSGRGIWTFTPNGAGTLAIYDWKIEAQKPLLRRLSWLLKPVFRWNHHWAMERGLESLKLELRRRAATSDAERAAIPPPPPPTRPIW